MVAPDHAEGAGPQHEDLLQHHPRQLLVFLQSFTKVGRQGAAAIASTKPSTAKGTKLKTLAKRSFVNFGNAGPS